MSRRPGLVVIIGAVGPLHSVQGTRKRAAVFCAALHRFTVCNGDFFRREGGWWNLRLCSLKKTVFACLSTLVNGACLKQPFSLRLDMEKLVVMLALKLGQTFL